MRGLNFTKEQADAHQRKHGFSPLSKEDKEALDRSKPKLFRDIKAILRMNKTEAEYALILEAMKRRGEILRYEYEGITLRWADMKYTPDFIVFCDTEMDQPVGIDIKFIEVKGGHIWDRDIVRFKGARAYWPEFQFEMHQKKQGQWTRLH